MSLPHWDPEVGGSRVNPGGCLLPLTPMGPSPGLPAFGRRGKGWLLGTTWPLLWWWSRGVLNFPPSQVDMEGAEQDQDQWMI